MQQAVIRRRRPRAALVLLLLLVAACARNGAHAWSFSWRRTAARQQLEQQREARWRTLAALAQPPPPIASSSAAEAAAWGDALLQQQQQQRQRQQQRRQPAAAEEEASTRRRGLLVAPGAAGGAAAAEAFPRAASAEEVMRAAEASLPRAEDLEALQLKLLQQEVRQLPDKIEKQLSDKLAGVLLEQVRSWLIDPAQAAVLNATLSGAYNPTGARMVHFKGHDLLVTSPRNDEFVGGYILKTGRPFSEHLLGPMLDLLALRPGSTVVDAGANLGAFSVFFAARVGPRGRVYSFEPQRRMYQMLSANAAVNGLLNIYAQHCALSFAPGELQMDGNVRDGAAEGEDLRRAEAEGHSINYGGMSLGAGGERVRAATLDSFNLTGVSLIKIDVQGAEKLVLHGAQATIRRNLPVIVYEEQAGFGVTEAMNRTMRIPPEVHRWNATRYLLSLGYKASPFQPSAEDVFMLPPGHAWLDPGRAPTQPPPPDAAAV